MSNCTLLSQGVSITSVQLDGLYDYRVTVPAGPDIEIDGRLLTVELAQHGLLLLDDHDDDIDFTDAGMVFSAAPTGDAPW